MTTADVVDLGARRAAKEEDGPHIVGAAICDACQNEWQAVAPAGTTLLECPGCRRVKGTFKHSVEPEVAWRCNCGNQLFWLTKNGALCRTCGVISSDWAN